jgi:hypothetical protein
MSATTERERAISLAKDRPGDALRRAREVSDPWYRAQALSWVARFTDGDPVAIASEAALAAQEADDSYQRCAVRAWEIAALAERDHILEARRRLFEILPTLINVRPPSSRSEALLLLLQASAKITNEDAEHVYEVMKISIQPEEHWRCKRALRDGAKIISGALQARLFFW